uniref:Zf-AD domain-containing protein n=1 Tax=Syphacia muris TaxID=451379 RepID=A0A0N5AGP3_9BILA
MVLELSLLYEQVSVQCSECSKNFSGNEQKLQQGARATDEDANGSAWWWCRNCLKTVCRYFDFERCGLMLSDILK